MREKGKLIYRSDTQDAADAVGTCVAWWNLHWGLVDWCADRPPSPSMSTLLIRPTPFICWTLQLRYDFIRNTPDNHIKTVTIKWLSVNCLTVSMVCSSMVCGTTVGSQRRAVSWGISETILADGIIPLRTASSPPLSGSG